MTLGGIPPGVGSGEGLDSLVNFEDIAGSSHGDTLTGDAEDNWIYAGNGATPSPAAQTPAPTGTRTTRPPPKTA